LDPGSYTLKVTGKIKGNDGAKSESFEGTTNVEIHAENCSN
jgi:hypothetical protein